MSSSPANLDQAPAPLRRSSRVWPWLALGLALAWVVVLRVPLVLNARAHLDSDLAVDGLVLVDAMQGKFHWHYPGTPFIGSIPVLLSMGPAAVLGVNPESLVAGGTVAFALLVAATFGLNWRAFGPSVAVWGLIPLTFASTGSIWLSGRITGGHLMAAVWHAAAFALLADGWKRGGGWKRAGLLGVWCGLGLYVDSMFAASWAGLAVAVVIGGWWGAPRPRSVRRALASLLAFGLGAGVGVLPRPIGAAVDPHNVYGDQFTPVFDYDTVVDTNLWHLLFDCEPRLIAGHRLPGMEYDPTTLPGGFRPVQGGGGWVFKAVTASSLLLFAWGIVRLIRGGRVGGDLRSRAIAWGLVGSSLVIGAAFLVASNITNSDNYRYLVFLLVPWSSGFGVLLGRWWSGGRVAKTVAVVVGVGFAGLMTVDAERWYGRLGWVDASGWRPTQVIPAEPVLDWLDDHSDVAAIYGDYWDVFRISFLTGGRVAGVPLPIYPNRFPAVTRRFPGGRPEILVVIDRRRSHAAEFRAQALTQGGRDIASGPGWSIVAWPVSPAPRRFAP